MPSAATARRGGRRAWATDASIQGLNARADRFPLFDGLRAIAALSIFVFHAGFGGFNGLPDVLRVPAAHLDVGVPIFFVISGFLLYRPFVRARFRGDPLPYVLGYAWRRFLRIVPAYWVALVVITIWLGLPDVFTPSGIPTYFGFLQVYSDSTSLGGIGQAWTLCIEVTFYILLPVWALGMRVGGGERSLRRELIALGVMFACGVAYLAFAVHHNYPRFPSPWFKTLPAYVDLFALGMAMAVTSAWYETRERVPRAAARLARFPGAPWLLAAAAFAAVCTIHVHGPVARYLFQHELYALVAVCVVAPAVLFPAGRGVPGRVLSTRFLLLIGLWSYAIYLWHPQVIDKLAVGPVNRALPSGAGWHTFGLGTIAFAITAAIAALSYYLVERPALSLKGTVGARRRAELGEAIAEPAPATPAEAPRS